MKHVKESGNKAKDKKGNNALKKNVKDFIYFLEDPSESGNLNLVEFNRKDVDALSLLSTATGKSLIFPKPEVLSHAFPDQWHDQMGQRK